MSEAKGKRDRSIVDEYRHSDSLAAVIDADGGIEKVLLDFAQFYREKINGKDEEEELLLKVTTDPGGDPKWMEFPIFFQEEDDLVHADGLSRDDSGKIIVGRKMVRLEDLVEFCTDKVEGTVVTTNVFGETRTFWSPAPYKAFKTLLDFEMGQETLRVLRYK